MERGLCSECAMQQSTPALLVADDVGNTVWRVTADSQKQAARAQ